ncbi:hypothetical protein LguiB_026468 [Lonicera macranthoides]
MEESAVSFALQRLCELRTEEDDFSPKLRDQIKDIQTELTRMQCILRDVDPILEGNWGSEIADLAYKTVDVVETYAIKVAANNEGKRGIKKFMRSFASIFNEGNSRERQLLSRSLYDSLIDFLKFTCDLRYTNYNLLIISFKYL